LAEARSAGAEVIKAARNAPWGGYAGYFRDLDGFLWEVAWNPDFPLDAHGRGAVAGLVAPRANHQASR
jgi:hypothetical protein